VRANAWTKGGPCPPKAPQYQTGLFQGGEIKPRRAAYADGLAGRLTERRLICYALARLAVLLVHGSAHCHARLAGSRSVRPVIIRQQRARARRDWRAKLGHVGARRISAQRLPRPRLVRGRGGPSFIDRTS
jgi:hypothetical protein